MVSIISLIHSIQIESIKVSSGTVYLPENSASIFSIRSFGPISFVPNLKELDLSGFDTKNVTNMAGMFSGCSKLTTLDVSGFDTKNVTNMAAMFSSCSSLTSLDVSNFDTSNVTNIYGMFQDCRNLLNLDLSNFETSKVTTMDSMFKDCRSLISLDVSNFDTSNVRTMNYMFSYCENLTDLDTSGFNTRYVTDMSCMFQCCESLTNLDVSGFKTSNVTKMDFMFSICKKLTNLDVSGFNTSNVTDTSCMFQWCESLTSLDLSNFDTSKVTDMSTMFNGCEKLTSLDVSSFDTSKVSDMENMFSSCKTLTSLDLGSFNTSNVENMSDMFCNCSNLVSLDLSSFDTSRVAEMDDMFTKCSALQMLKTPKKNEIKAELPAVMIDDAGNEYEELPVLSESIVLTRKQTDTRIDISDCKITLSATSYTYDGKVKEPAVTVKNGSSTLTAGKDYTVSYANNTNVGTATVKVEGIGNYKGEKIITFKINEPAASGFSDVQDPTHPYYNAIYWAADAGITGGYKDGTFGIDKPCTRGHAVMFLWKMKGKPEPNSVSKTPFPDVPKTHPYYKAVLWAQQNGITKGYTSGVNKGKFGIDDTCTRGQIMTFIWNFKDKPAPKSVSKSPFSDVPTSHPYYKAILWGSQNGVTKGYTTGPNAGKFGINDNCTRGQIVKFLYNIR